MNHGGLSTTYIESIGSRNIGTELHVGISREATLTEDLSRIESRALRGIVIEVGSGEGAHVVTLSRQAVEWLWDVLGAALRATEDTEDGAA